MKRAAAWISRNRAMTAAAGFWILFAANFNRFSLNYVDDPQRVYNFLQRLFGDRHSPADAYQFGEAIGWIPFYLLGKLIALSGIHSVGGKPFVAGVVALSGSVFALTACAVLVPLIKRLRLPHPTLILVLAFFGGPLWFYGSFAPGHTHAMETTVIGAAVLLLYFELQTPKGSIWLELGMGVLLAFAMAIRYFLGPAAVAFILGLAFYRRWRAAAVVTATPLVSLALLAVVAEIGAGGILKGAAYRGSGSESALNVLVLAPLNPFRMLFTQHRGLLIWSPVTILAIVGFVRLMRHRPDQRPFLSICAFTAFMLTASYALAPYWDGGYASYNQRYLTALFPFVVLGLGGIVDWRPRLVVSLAVVCVAWTMALGFYEGLSIAYLNRGVVQFPEGITHGRVTPGLLAYDLYHGSNIRGLIPDPYNDH